MNYPFGYSSEVLNPFYTGEATNENALALAHYLDAHSAVEKVHYPGLPSHPDHALAKKQMRAYTGMMSFELKANVQRTTLKKFSTHPTSGEFSRK